MVRVRYWLLRRTVKWLLALATSGTSMWVKGPYMLMSADKGRLWRVEKHVLFTSTATFMKAVIHELLAPVVISLG